jgi:hypothetical protein
MEKINWPLGYSAGLELAIGRGWLWLQGPM